MTSTKHGNDRASPAGSKTILVVDDSLVCREFARIVLEREGFQVLEAVNGNEAITIAMETHPDLVLLDIRMPVLDGFDTVKAIRSSSGTSSICVIAMTAHAMKGERDRALRAGFDGYLTKPLRIGELREGVLSAPSRAQP
jgi:two-component system cell cycle response regulator DivK